jgi:arsenate reductase-like glutaredoxin family protein
MAFKEGDAGIVSGWISYEFINVKYNLSMDEIRYIIKESDMDVAKIRGQNFVLQSDFETNFSSILADKKKKRRAKINSQKQKTQMLKNAINEFQKSILENKPNSDSLKDVVKYSSMPLEVRESLLKIFGPSDPLPPP